MAKFYGSVQGNRGEAHRLGHSRIDVSAQTWEFGVHIRGGVNLNGDIIFQIYQTSGSNGGNSDKLIAIVDKNGLNFKYGEIQSYIESNLVDKF